MWLGFDKGDPLFDQAETRERLHDIMADQAQGKSVSFSWVQYDGMQGKVFWIYNDLFRQAYAEVS